MFFPWMLTADTGFSTSVSSQVNTRTGGTQLWQRSHTQTMSGWFREQKQKKITSAFLIVYRDDMLSEFIAFSYNVFKVSQSLSIFVFTVSQIIAYLSFCDWLISFSIMSCRCIHVAACCRTLFLLKTEWYSTVCIEHIWLIIQLLMKTFVASCCYE